MLLPALGRADPTVPRPCCPCRTLGHWRKPSLRPSKLARSPASPSPAQPAASKKGQRVPPARGQDPAPELLSLAASLSAFQQPCPCSAWILGLCERATTVTVAPYPIVPHCQGQGTAFSTVPWCTKLATSSTTWFHCEDWLVL